MNRQSELLAHERRRMARTTDWPHNIRPLPRRGSNMAAAFSSRPLTSATVSSTPCRAISTRRTCLRGSPTSRSAATDAISACSGVRASEMSGVEEGSVDSPPFAAGSRPLVRSANRNGAPSVAAEAPPLALFARGA